ADMITDELRLLPARAAHFIRQHPVPTRGAYTPETRLSVLDILVHCAPVRGEAFVAFQLLSRRALPNSYLLRLDVLDDALAALDSFTVTEDECEQTFGPNWTDVVRHAVDVAALVDEQFGALTRTSGAVDGRRRLGAWICARDAASEAGRIKSWYHAQDAAWERRYMDEVTLREDERRCADLATAVRDAAAAHAVSDLVGTHDFTRAHYETLLDPWLLCSQQGANGLPRALHR
ncbi:MAG TPA: hypothetical protein VJ831_03500, partial [Jatrophihabitantaceae bacterium]|nr:hypothetical protein [Jatrophihabitantaceae bacterium]